MKLGQRLLIQPEMRQRVDQLAFLLAQVAAPDHRQQLPLGDRHAESDWAFVAGPRADFDHFTRETSVDVGQVVGIQHERAGKLQRQRNRAILHRADSNWQSLDDAGGETDCAALVAGHLDQWIAGTRSGLNRQEADPRIAGQGRARWLPDQSKAQR